jgi:hypothetical protein
MQTLLQEMLQLLAQKMVETPHILQVNDTELIM